MVSFPALARSMTSKRAHRRDCLPGVRSAEETLYREKYDRQTAQVEQAGLKRLGYKTRTSPVRSMSGVGVEIEAVEVEVECKLYKMAAA